MPFVLLLLAFLSFPVEAPAAQVDKPGLQPKDVFSLQWVSDPQISPDGKRILYVRNFMDIMKDRRRSNLWILSVDGSSHQAITSGMFNDSSPRWSPDGKRVLFLSNREGGKTQLHVLWLDTNRSAPLTRGMVPPISPSWSPDGKSIAFLMHVDKKEKPFIELPTRPEGAEWAAPAKIISQTVYRADGRGYLRPGTTQAFVIPADGGAARQLTQPPLDLSLRSGSPAWTPDGKSLIIASRSAKGDEEPQESELFEINVETGVKRQLTNRRGPDHSPAVSPDGKLIAYLGFDDRRLGHQITRLSVMNREGKQQKVLTSSLDRDVQNPQFNHDGTRILFQYDDQGNTKVGSVSLDGKLTTLAENVGGTTLDRPYASGSFSVAGNGNIAFTLTGPEHPADVGFTSGEKPGITRLTKLNAGLFAQRSVPRVEEIWYKSSHDDQKIQGWIVKPATFDPNKKYPLILEIHGGPFANYGNRFALDMHLYAAAGYVVLFTNPRGSTSYGEKFGNLIHHAYPGNDYDDLMSGVDAVIARGYIDKEKLFVTGGSGGGILSAWIVGKTNRFRAAVVAKPVINWYSFVLTSDMYVYFTQYWFPGHPWDHTEHYLKRSPLTLVKNVKTPTMLLTGEEDHRTPMSESEQFYQALKLRRVDTMLVRIPGASHSIEARPSQAITKTLCVLKWFERYRK